MRLGVCTDAGLVGCVSNEMGCAVCAHEFVTRSAGRAVCVLSPAVDLSVPQSSSLRRLPTLSFTHTNTHFIPLLHFFVLLRLFFAFTGEMEFEP